MTTFTTEDRKAAQGPRDRIENECPCDSCEHFMVCKEQEWACRSFASYVWNNYYYVDATKIPCRGTFNKIFNSNDNKELKEYLKQFIEDSDADKFKDNAEK